MSEEEFGTEQEREQVIRDIEIWAEFHRSPDSVGIAFILLGSAKIFTPRELATDIREGTALGVVMLDVIISESRKAGILPIDYVKRMTKVLRSVPGELIKNPPFKDELN